MEMKANLMMMDIFGEMEMMMGLFFSYLSSLISLLNSVFLVYRGHPIRFLNLKVL